MEANNGKESDSIEKNCKAKSSKVKESQCYNISVFINHHQSFRNFCNFFFCFY